jgi:hypothetical protein
MNQQESPNQNGNRQDDRVDLSFLIDGWPSELIARAEVGSFTGGMISSGTMANLDSAGEGPEDAIRIGRKAGYRVVSFVRWLEKRTTRLRANAQVQQHRPQRSEVV